MTEILSGLTWPGAFAIVGSVVAVVTGLLALFLDYLRRSTKNGNGNGARASSLSPENLQIHERISNLRDRVATIEGQQLVFATQVEHLLKQISDHDARDADDFKTINAKVDKLMEIIVEMLKNDD